MRSGFVLGSRNDRAREWVQTPRSRRRGPFSKISYDAQGTHLSISKKRVNVFVATAEAVRRFSMPQLPVSAGSTSLKV